MSTTKKTSDSCVLYVDSFKTQRLTQFRQGVGEGGVMSVRGLAVSTNEYWAIWKWLTIKHRHTHRQTETHFVCVCVPYKYDNIAIMNYNYYEASSECKWCAREEKEIWEMVRNVLETNMKSRYNWEFEANIKFLLKKTVDRIRIVLN